MSRNFKKYRKYYLAILFAVILVLLPIHPAKAGWLAEWTIEHTFGYVLFIVMSVAGKMIGALATLLNWAIHIPVYPDGGIAVIDKSWEIMRNFANMFFIVALIMMAFATIFDVLPGAAKYNARALFGRFLLTALLINFSLVLGVLVIQGTQVLSNTFLVAIGDMANRLGQDLNPSQLLPSQSSVTAAVSLDAVVFGTLATLIFSIILIFTYLFSILTALIFVFIRIPILWALLIVSPMAWIMNVFPAGEGTFKKWWAIFFGWNMFLPIYLFFLYFGLYFLSNQRNIIQSIASEVSQAKISESLPFSLQLVFFYVMTAIFMIGGTIVAMKASMFSGTGVVGIAKWSRGIAAKRLGLTGANQAWQEKRKEIEGGEGRLGRIFGGPPAGLETSRRLLGVQGAGDIKPQKEFLAKMDKEAAVLRDQETTGKIIVDNTFKASALRQGANTAKGAAMRSILYERGMIDATEFDRDMAEWTQKNPFLAQRMSEQAKKGKYKKVPGKQLNDMYTAQAGSTYEKYRTPGATASRKEWFSFAAEDDDSLKTMDTNNIATGVGLHGGKDSNDGKEKLKTVAKKRPDVVAEYKLKEDGLTTTPLQLSRYIFKEIKNKSPIDLSKMLDATWANPSFQDALSRKASLLQRIQPSQPARPGKKAVPGGGDTFKSGLKKAVQNNPRKLKIARTI
ncbi:MAG: hypothetical protein A3I26_03895 [Candidatus Yanofskybacteria bacterium RIFCSPLOWO2_02_FULL_43_10]|uniref:Uncharacterized protein n=1 Tax=Candidatus Yanofskybacteria bacterium RIFCSPLOWO2_12_FULL_43_11b TaxID=1802710 RepID=A0A1F8H8T9_9BACT|nr:MAG: hypothetical protein A2742_03220 [Candidatus Yanofskybacteria bacterium RIFCSPHIGHO2_01_FULL_43_32]OGN10799.1 MAG: hypothetical protein A3C69_01390 [Candidatus Yanofskybacteria bacterium RIFCSPHIGHO2_02_FULL_43_12]OGN17998.1 MAG: hypothetical protein A3E34_01885 [Candidatus Yanofskybacteria bacterium RIFCSPHIGHO2_12_FULL_43_11]OGN25019.1 MAG: hypothetical protein A2923_03585 [Candidatus Yanofskybacteria bacterium RIFCSPLOWO2_01_FULL_43_46]OGN30771.1 MAG: hypothetical protein A3I26_03895